MKRKTDNYLWNCLYVAYLLCLLVGFILDSKYNFDYQAIHQGDIHKGIAFYLPVIYRYILCGVLLGAEPFFAQKAGIVTRFSSRLILIGFMLYQIFKLYVFHSFSLLNEWSYSHGAIALLTGYLILRVMNDLVDVLRRHKDGKA